jgi:hypothetical protein
VNPHPNELSHTETIIVGISIQIMMLLNLLQRPRKRVLD